MEPAENTIRYQSELTFRKIPAPKKFFAQAATTRTRREQSFTLVLVAYNTPTQENTKGAKPAPKKKKKRAPERKSQYPIKTKNLGKLGNIRQKRILSEALKKIILIFSSIVVVYFLLAISIYIAFSDWVSRGQFGDMFGAINTLFSALAFAGLITAILVQKEEIKEQRQELRKSVEAQIETEKALKKQVELMNFTSKLNAHNTIISSGETILSRLEGVPGNEQSEIIALRNASFKKIKEILNHLETL